MCKINFQRNVGAILLFSLIACNEAAYFNNGQFTCLLMFLQKVDITHALDTVV